MMKALSSSYCSTYADNAASRGSAVTSGAANTKGAWVSLGIGNTRSKGFILNIESSENCDFLVDISIGTTVVVSNIFFSSISAAGSCRVAQFFIPVGLTSETAQIRCQSNGVSKVLYATIHDFDFGCIPCAVSNTYGANTADTGGVSVDPGGTIHTKGAYSEIVAAASMTRAAKGFFLCFGGQANAAMTTASWLVDIAFGGAGSEVIMIPDIPLSVYGATGLVTPGNTVFIPMPIAAGQRISAAAQCSINDATDRLIDVILYTVS